MSPNLFQASNFLRFPRIMLKEQETSSSTNPLLSASREVGVDPRFLTRRQGQDSLLTTGMMKEVIVPT